MITDEVFREERESIAHQSLNKTQSMKQTNECAMNIKWGPMAKTKSKG